MYRLGSANDVGGMLVEFRTAISGINHHWLAPMHVIWLEAAEFYSEIGVFLHWCCLQSWLPFQFSTWIILINLAAFQSSRGILQRNEKNGRKHHKDSFPDGTVQGSSKIKRTACYYQWTSWNDRRSDRLYWAVAQKLVRCVLSCMRWIDNWAVGRSQTHPRCPSWGQSYWIAEETGCFREKF